MGKLKLLLIAAVTMAMTIGLAGMASAATVHCGQCHGTIMNNMSSGASGSASYDLRNTGAAAPYENDLMPQADNGRGLHGVHMNYSSATYTVSGQLTGTNMSPGGIGQPSRGVCSYCHDPRHQNHEGGFMQWSTISVNYPGNGTTHVDSTMGKPLTKGFMRYSSDNGGTSDRKNSISSIPAGPRTGYCTAACHKGTSAANPAKWGDYTDPTVRLTCNSCHGDASDNGAVGTGSGLSAPLNVGHQIHLNSVTDSHGTYLTGGVPIILANTSTAGIMYPNAAGGNTNAVCALCHPDNTGEGATTKDWGPGLGQKAYPHASDGTNVVYSNAVVGGKAGVSIVQQASSFANLTSKTGLGTTCTNICHANHSSKAGSYETGLPPWNGKFVSGTGGGCDICHNHQPSAMYNTNAGRPLSFAHSLHFEQISSMHIGSGLRGLPSCSDCHNPSALHGNYAGVVNLVQLPVKDGTAGLFTGTDAGELIGSVKAGGTQHGPIGWTGAGHGSAGATLTTSGTCTNDCHIAGSPNWNIVPTGYVKADMILAGTETGCATCHEYPGAANDWASTNGHSVRAAQTLGTAGALKHLNLAANYNKTTDSYAGVTGDPAMCGKCHSGATHMNHVINVNAASTGAASGFTLATTFIPGQGHVAQCSNVKCHFGRKTPNWY